MFTNTHIIAATSDKSIGEHFQSFFKPAQVGFDTQIARMVGHQGVAEGAIAFGLGGRDFVSRWLEKKGWKTLFSVRSEIGNFA